MDVEEVLQSLFHHGLQTAKDQCHKNIYINKAKKLTPKEQSLQNGNGF